MRIEWTVEKNEQNILRTFLQKHGISKRILTKVKFHGGQLEVNGNPVRVRQKLEEGDVVHMTLPTEKANPWLSPSKEELELIYEDEHFLIVNKPAGIASVPSMTYPDQTMANRVQGYIKRRNYIHQTVHVVTRLDKDTSGVMIFAKHTLAHSMMDQLLREKKLKKKYEAIVTGQVKTDHGLINEPITRTEDSIITRKVGKDGKESLTEYWLKEDLKDMTRVNILLHTGRTHQIRVHFSHIGHPLVGDDLYGGNTDLFKRQALHCKECSFRNPFTNKQITATAQFPEDIKQLLEKRRSE